MNIAHCRPAQGACANDPHQIALDQSDAGTLDRDIRPRAHGDPHICARQRRRVIDAIAGHGDDLAGRLQSPDELALLRR